jgi:hypothetical protein
MGRQKHQGYPRLLADSNYRRHNFQNGVLNAIRYRMLVAPYSATQCRFMLPPSAKICPQAVRRYTAASGIRTTKVSSTPRASGNVYQLVIDESEVNHPEQRRDRGEQSCCAFPGSVRRNSRLILWRDDERLRAKVSSMAGAAIDTHAGAADFGHIPCGDLFGHGVRGSGDGLHRLGIVNEVEQGTPIRINLLAVLGMAGAALNAQ